MRAYRDYSNKESRWTLGWNYLLFMFVALGIGWVFYLVMGRPIYYMWFGRGAETTVAVVYYAEVADLNPLEASYVFEVDGKMYTGKSWAKTTGNLETSTLTLVYYNPQDPNVNYIDPSLQPLTGKYLASPCIGGLLIPGMFLGAGYCFFAVFIPSWRLDSDS